MSFLIKYSIVIAWLSCRVDKLEDEVDKLKNKD